MNEEQLALAAEKRQSMLADLATVILLCNCLWPLTKYRNGDGHDPQCPAHVAIKS